MPDNRMMYDYSLSKELIKAVKHHGADKVREILNKSVNNLTADPNAADEISTKTVLHIACEQHKKDCIEILIAHEGIDINKTDSNGKSALHYAIGDRKCMELLMDHGANTSSVDVFSESPLQKAMKSKNADCISLLLDRGADVKQSNWIGKSALKTLHENGCQLFIEILRKSNKPKVQRLFIHLIHEKSDNCNCKSIINDLPQDSKEWLEKVFLNSCYEGCEKCMKLLIDLNVDINYKDEQHRTALHFGALAGRSQCIKILGENTRFECIDERDEEGNTALHKAAEGGFKKSVKVLTDVNADLYITNNEDMRPYDVALEKRHVFTADFLEKRMKINVRERFLSVSNGLFSSRAVISNLYLRGLCFIFNITLKDEWDKRNKESQTLWKIFRRLGYKVMLYEYDFETYRFDNILNEMRNNKPAHPYESFICLISFMSHPMKVDCEDLFDSLNHGLFNVFLIKSGNRSTDLSLRLQDNYTAWIFFPDQKSKLSYELCSSIQDKRDSLSLHRFNEELESKIELISGSTHPFDFMKIDEERRKIYDQINKGTQFDEKELPEELKIRDNKHPECLSTLGELKLWTKSNTQSNKKYCRIGAVSLTEIESMAETFAENMLKSFGCKPAIILSIEYLGTKTNRYPEDIDQVRQTVRQALQKVLKEKKTWLLTDGLNFGVPGRVKDKSGKHQSYVIGIAPWRAFYDIDFDGDETDGFLNVKSFEDPSEDHHLNSDHTHFVFHQTEEQCNLPNVRHVIEMAVLNKLRASPSPDKVSNENETKQPVPKRRNKGSTEETYELMERETAKSPNSQQNVSTSPVFLKIVLSSCSNKNAVKHAQINNYPLVFLKLKDKEDERVSFDRQFLRCDSHTNSHIHVVSKPEDISPIITYFLKEGLKPGDALSVHCEDHQTASSRLMKAVIDNDIEEAKCSNWKEAFKEKNAASRIMIHAFQNDEADFVELFYKKEYMVSDFLTGENLIELHETDCKSQKDMIKRLRENNEVSNKEEEKLNIIKNRIAELSGFSVVNIYSNSKKSNYSEVDLFFWALLQRRFKLARLFWKQGQDQIELALIAVGILRNLCFEANIEKNTETIDSITIEMQIYEELAIQLIKSADSVSHILLNRRIRYCENRTVLWLAEHNQCGKFLREPVCRLEVNYLWNPYFTHFSRSWPVKIIQYLAAGFFMGRLFKSIRNCTETKDNINYVPAVKCLRYGLFHIAYFLLLTVMSLLYFEPRKIHWLEYIAFQWTLDVAFSEFMQIKRHIDELPSKNIRIAFNKYFESNWNIVDLSYILLLFISFISRMIIYYYAPLYRYNINDLFLISRIPLNISLFLISIRIIQYYEGIKTIGVAALIAYEMFCRDVFRIGIIYLSFLVGFGVLVCTLKYPVSTEFATSMNNILNYPFWQLFGEVNLDFFSGDTLEPHPNESKQWISIYIILVFSGVYMMISNILLLNLLIAMFGSTYNQVKMSAKKIWAQRFFILFYEYEKKSLLPPPFTIFCALFKAPCGKNRNYEFYCYKNSIKLDEDDYEIMSDYFRSTIPAIVNWEIVLQNANDDRKRELES